MWINHEAKHTTTFFSTILHSPYEYSFTDVIINNYIMWPPTKQAKGFINQPINWLTNFLNKNNQLTNCEKNK